MNSLGRIIFNISGFFGFIILIWLAFGMGYIKRRKEYLQMMSQVFYERKDSPSYNYDDVMQQIRYTTWPLSLGTFSAGLHVYLGQYSELLGYNPGIWFLVSSFAYYLMSLLVGLGIGYAMVDPSFQVEFERKSRPDQAKTIVALFLLGLFGISFGIFQLITIEIYNFLFL